MQVLNKETRVLVSPIMGGTIWKIAGRDIDLSYRGMIMGVLNVTPDSFSDGGKFFSSEPAIAQAEQMARDGAQIIDVGGESTRPGAEPISADEELRRVLPVIKKLREKVSAFISIDTSKAEVARAALEAGASIINDVTGGRGDAKCFRSWRNEKPRSSSCTCKASRARCRSIRITMMWCAKWPIFFDNNMSASYNQELIPWLLRLIRESGSEKRSNII